MSGGFSPNHALHGQSFSKTLSLKCIGKADFKIFTFLTVWYATYITKVFHTNCWQCVQYFTLIQVVNKVLL